MRKLCKSRAAVYTARLLSIWSGLLCEAPLDYDNKSTTTSRWNEGYFLRQVTPLVASRAASLSHTVRGERLERKERICIWKTQSLLAFFLYEYSMNHIFIPSCTIGVIVRSTPLSLCSLSIIM